MVWNYATTDPICFFWSRPCRMTTGAGTLIEGGALEDGALWLRVDVRHAWTDDAAERIDPSITVGSLTASSGRTLPRRSSHPPAHGLGA